MRLATVDRYLKPAGDRMRIKGISTTKPSPLLRDSITIRICADGPSQAPGRGVIEADTVAHCGPTRIGEYASPLTLTELVTGWTENPSKWMIECIAELQECFPFHLISIIRR